MKVGNKQGKQWEVIVEYVSFPNERARQRAYEQYADTIIAGYRNELKLKEQERQKSKGLENLADK